MPFVFVILRCGWIGLRYSSRILEWSSPRFCLVVISFAVVLCCIGGGYMAVGERRVFGIMTCPMGLGHTCWHPVDTNGCRASPSSGGWVLLCGAFGQLVDASERCNVQQFVCRGCLWVDELVRDLFPFECRRYL